ncbi:DUF1133 family protein [Citrobacter koseri]|uniref:DUF1133 family protein n=1 Tax=Citrobacter koseri TaxID=545 RepID=UPI0019072A26|nr:DUF1133 family protein [Citrobacter koseri]EMD6815684.1 DUF1133 family protein [Citrobacter koseri]MBJ9010658.1 DUF1133 family protein [Citrobacter koseri]
MIYPTNTGKAGEMIRLNTLESMMVQGRLKMWGRWSYIGGGRAGNMFNQLLVNKKITKTAINEALRRMKKAGISKPDLEIFLREMMTGNKKSHLAHCTDAEALIIDRVVGTVLADHPALIELLHERYDGKGKSKKKLARELNDKHPEWCLRTCESRIDVWLHTAEYMLYIPLCDAFCTDSSKFRLRACAETA